MTDFLPACGPGRCRPAAHSLKLTPAAECQAIRVSREDSSAGEPGLRRALEGHLRVIADNWMLHVKKMAFFGAARALAVDSHHLKGVFVLRMYSSGFYDECFITFIIVSCVGILVNILTRGSVLDTNPLCIPGISGVYTPSCAQADSRALESVHAPPRKNTRDLFLHLLIKGAKGRKKKLLL